MSGGTYEEMRKFIHKLSRLPALADDFRRMKANLAQAQHELLQWRTLFARGGRPLLDALGPSLFPGRRFLYEPPANRAEEILRRLEAAHVPVETRTVDPAAYREYMHQAAYESYPEYAHQYRAELPFKSMQHYLSLELLDIRAEDVVMDVASSTSVFAEILHRRHPGLTVYRQDLTYPPGVNGQVIGSNAADIPLSDGSVDKMTLHCSFEHFEGDSDCGYVREAARLLRPGGKVCIIPLYLSEVHHIVTHPEMWITHWIPEFDPGAPLLALEKKTSVHGRYYEPETFAGRLLDPARPLSVRVIFFSNHHECAGCPRFAALFTKS